MRIHSSRKRIIDWPVAASPPADAARSRGPDDRRIGVLLQRSGDLGFEQAEQVARAQAAHGTRFGETAVALGFADQAAVDRALARQFDFAVAHAGQTVLDPSLATAHGGRDRASELIRSLRARLALALDEVAEPVVLVASLTGKVGRRVIAGNLAVAFAQAGTRTLLVDADLREPTLHRLFGMSNAAGLSTLLVGRDGAAQPVAEIPGLSVLPAGPPPPNPVELLSRLAPVLAAQRLATRAELVLVNAAPFERHDDGYAVAGAAGHALIVLRRDFTRSDRAAQAARRLAAAGCAITGSVLNVS